MGEHDHTTPIPKTIQARKILALRSRLSDQSCLDILHIWLQFPEGVGLLQTAALCRQWNCCQSTVSRRIGRLTGYIDYTPGCGGYQIHSITTPG